MQNQLLQQISLIAQLQGMSGLEASYATRGRRLNTHQYRMLMRCYRLQSLALPDARNNVAWALDQLHRGNQRAALAALEGAQKSLDLFKNGEQS